MSNAACLHNFALDANLFEFLAPFGHDFGRLALNDDVRIAVVRRDFQIEARDFGTAALGEALESCSRVNDAACADVGEFIAVLQGILDFVHVQRRFAKENDVRADASSANGAARVHGFFSAEFEFMAV